jgi:hypothetical protein
MLDLSEASVAFRAASPRDSFTNEVSIAANNKVTNLSDNKLTLTLAPASGLFRGTVVSPGGAGSMPFGGVILQNQDAGSGCFLQGTQGGRVDLSDR